MTKESKKILLYPIFLVLFFLIFNSKTVFAESTYVLPYPSTMPGTIYYKLHLIEEKIMQYWYFGNFGQFTYNLKESDKYLVEAKTLFEYDQYLLGVAALKKSDAYFIKTLPDLVNARKEGKDISENRAILSSAALKHKEVLQKLVHEVPPVFNWTPEKSAATELNLKQAIDNSIQVREKYL